MRQQSGYVCEEGDGETCVFEDCEPRDWDLFLVPGSSPGQYLTRTLQNHPYSFVPRDQRQ